jgi:hypothetical protein
VELDFKVGKPMTKQTEDGWISRWALGKKLSGGFVAVLLVALSLGLFGIWMTSRTSGKVNLVSAAYLPVNDMAAQIERELLNARIHFIYFVTVQKDGALPAGWKRFENAKKELPKLQQLVQTSKELAVLRPELDRLCRDLESYQPVLERIIGVVQKRQNRGPGFASLLTEWARLGNAMVESAGQLSRRGSADAARAATHATTDLGSARKLLAVGCGVCLLVGAFMSLFLTRHITRSLRRVCWTSAMQPIKFRARRRSSRRQRSRCPKGLPNKRRLSKRLRRRASKSTRWQARTRKSHCQPRATWSTLRAESMRPIGTWTRWSDR